MRYIVFLDFDGVLTSHRVQMSLVENRILWTKFDENAIRFLNKIHHKYYDVSFVWTTTWRNHIDAKSSMIQHWAYSMFDNAGFEGRFGMPWKVNPENDLNLHSQRALEIKDYLENHAVHNQDYLILDDSDYEFNSILKKKRFVKTDSNDGLLFKHILEAEKIMKDWETK